MITTPLKILQAVSVELGESVTDTSMARLVFFNKAVHFYFSKFPFRFRIKTYSLVTTTANEYGLTSLIDDYDPTFGIYLVQTANGEQLVPIDYADRGEYSEQENNYVYYLTPDKKTIGFPSVESGTTYTIYYYAVHKDVSSSTETLNVAIPEGHLSPIVNRILFHIYNRKRQRYDARNAMLDFKEELEDIITQEGRNKRIGNFPLVAKSVKELLGY